MLLLMANWTLSTLMQGTTMRYRAAAHAGTVKIHLVLLPPSLSNDIFLPSSPSNVLFLHRPQARLLRRDGRLAELVAQITLRRHLLWSRLPSRGFPCGVGNQTGLQSVHDGTVHLGAVKGAVDEFTAAHGLKVVTTQEAWPSWMARKP